MPKLRTGVNQFNLRIPQPLLTRVKEIALENRRSMNSEILARIEITLAGKHETQKGEVTA